LRVQGSGSGIVGLLWDAVLDPVDRVVVDAVVAHGDRSSHIGPVGGGGLCSGFAASLQPHKCQIHSRNFLGSDVCSPKWGGTRLGLQTSCGGACFPPRGHCPWKPPRSQTSCSTAPVSATFQPSPPPTSMNFVTLSSTISSRAILILHSE